MRAVELREARGGVLKIFSSPAAREVSKAQAHLFCCRFPKQRVGCRVLYIISRTGIWYPAPESVARFSLSDKNHKS